MIGIYFLLDNEKVVYVGQSINISSRIREHERESVKKFDSFTCVKCSKELLDYTEESYILKYNPKYNVRRAEIKVKATMPTKKKEKIEIKEIEAESLTDFVYFYPSKTYFYRKNLYIGLSENDYAQLEYAEFLVNTKLKENNISVKLSDIARQGIAKEVKNIIKKSLKKG